MPVTCIKCHEKGTLSLNQYKTNGHVYKYYGIQHYDPTTKKRHWCYLGKYESLPDQYKLVIHKKQRLSTNDTQTQTTRKSRVSGEKAWCGGWDSNPRTPVGQGPKPCAFNDSYIEPSLTRLGDPRVKCVVEYPVS
jgi:hypothetical protein